MASRLDINGILEATRTILADANTTTASADLSADLTTRVKMIQKIHPERIRPNADVIPLVTCYVAEKTPADQTFAKNQSNNKRRQDISLKVVGAVFDQTYTNINKDPADEQIHYLMENIELVLRSNENLNGTVLWQMPDGPVKYYDMLLDHDTHMRFGILTLKAVQFT